MQNMQNNSLKSDDVKMMERCWKIIKVNKLCKDQMLDELSKFSDYICPIKI